MGIVDQIAQMKQLKKSDAEIISELSKQYNPNEIKNALDALQIKNAVGAIQGDDVPTPGGYENANANQDYYQQAPQGQTYAAFDQSQVYTPQPQQPAYYPQQGGYQQSYSQQGYGDYYSQSTTSTDTIVEVAEQVFDEKISPISKKVDASDEFKTLTQAKLENMNERLKRIELIIDKLQSAILEKIGSYGSDLESIKKEMSMMQDSFGKALEPVARIAEKAGRGRGQESEKVSKKRK